MREAVKEALEWASKASVDEALEVLDQFKEFMLDSRKGKVNGISCEEGFVSLDGSRPIAIIGDIHGDLESYSKILTSDNINSVLINNGIVVFLGDYVDRGLYSPEVYLSLLKLTLNLKGKIIPLRGNHEPHPKLIPYPHDLPLQLRRRFGVDGVKIYTKFMETFQCLFHAGRWGEKIFLVHGGVPTEEVTLEDLARADTEYPTKRTLEELLWNDPIDGFNGWLPSPRGAGRLCGEDITRRFLREVVNTKIVVRGHEPCEGYKINHNGLVLTLFSRGGPPYFNTVAAYVTLGAQVTFKSVNDIVNYIHIFHVIT